MEDKRNKFLRKGKSRKKIGILGLLMAVGAVMAAVSYLYMGDAPSKHGVVSVSIPQEATGKEIAELLKEKGVIANATLFKWAVYLTGTEKQLHSGRFKMETGLTVREALYEMQHAREEYATVTIPEGYTVAQMGVLLEEAGVCKREEFISEASSYGPLPYMYGPEAAMIKGEGFLFADTYDIPYSYTVRQICDMMYARTDKILTEERRKQAQEKHMTLHDLMTVASMVEREARYAEDAKPIASVILARLDKGMPLQIDATVQYVLGKQKKELTVADTEIPSPYNTYLRKGLPPGPIAAPGQNAVQAVLDAAPGKYLYYVAQQDGHHVFTETLEEHEAETDRIYGTHS